MVRNLEVAGNNHSDDRHVLAYGGTSTTKLYTMTLKLNTYQVNLKTTITRHVGVMRGVILDLKNSCSNHSDN